MKRETFLLKAVIFAVGFPVLVLCIIGIPWLVKNPVSPGYAHILYPIVIGIYISVIPFYIALYNALRLLGYIDKNIAFSNLSVSALTNKYQVLCNYNKYHVCRYNAIFLSLSSKRGCSGSNDISHGAPVCFRNNCSLCCFTAETVT